MQSDVSPNVYDTFSKIIAMMGMSFSLKDLIEYLQAWREKNLRIEPDTMPSGMFGYCAALLDLDLICIRPDLDSALEIITLLHEISHLLLGHLKKHPKGELTTPYIVFIKRRNQETLLYRKRYYDTLHTGEREQDAESLATLLLECIERYDGDLPDIIKNLHG